jgi:hypothetical protein
MNNPKQFAYRGRCLRTRHLGRFPLRAHWRSNC